jgi:hypothetical protein
MIETSWKELKHPLPRSGKRAVRSLMVRLSECGVVDLADEGMKGVGDATKTSSVHEPKKMKPTAAGVTVPSHE